MTAVVANWGAQFYLKMNSRDMMQTRLTVLVEHPSPAVIDAVSFDTACLEKAHRAMANSLSQLTANTAALTIGPKPTNNAEDKGTIDWQNKEIKRLNQAVSSGFKREAMPIKNHDVQSLIRWIHVPCPGGFQTGARGRLSLIAAASADGAGLERRHPQREIAAWDCAHTR